MESPMGRESWLAQIDEPALKPDLPIIDPHHHFWDRLDHRYLAEDLLTDISSGHNVEATVFIECSSDYYPDGPEALRPVGETEFVVTQAKAAAQVQADRAKPINLAAAIVGYADLTLGTAVDDVLDGHLIAGDGRFRGIRHAAGWDASPKVRNSHTNPPWGLFASREFQNGFDRLAKHGLSFEAWLYHHQIPEVTDLALRFPETAIVLNHFGGPVGIGPYEGRRAEIFAQWKQDIRALAACENVVIKLGGMAMTLNGYRWHKRETPLTSEEFAGAYGDWYHDAIDVFGPARCMFESNFPVDRVSISYGSLWNGFKRLAAGYSDAEKADMFYHTAARFYRLED